MSDIQFNVNNYVHVKLTPKGYAQFLNFHLALGVKIPPSVTPDGDLKIQLWELMQIFGKEIYSGNFKVMFENNSITIPQAEA